MPPAAQAVQICLTLALPLNPLQMSFTFASQSSGRRNSGAVVRSLASGSSRRESAPSSLSWTTASSKPRISIPNQEQGRPDALRFAIRRSSGILDSKGLLSKQASFIDLADLAEFSPVELEAGERSPVHENPSSSDPLLLTAAYVRHFISTSVASSSSKARKTRPRARPLQLFQLAAFWIAVVFFLSALFGRTIFSGPSRDSFSQLSSYDQEYALAHSPFIASARKASSTSAASDRQKYNTEERWADVARGGGHTAALKKAQKAKARAEYSLDQNKWNVLMDDILL